MITTTLPAGTPVVITGVHEVNPQAVLNGRTGEIVKYGRTGRTATIRLTHAVNQHDVDLAGFDGPASIEDLADDQGSSVRIHISNLNVLTGEPADQGTSERAEQIHEVLLEIHRMARRTADDTQLWILARDFGNVTTGYINAHLPFCHTVDDAVAWVHEHAASTRFGF